MTGRKSLTIGPMDLEWLAGALKLDELISETPALEQILDSLPAIHLESWPSGEEALHEGDRGDDIFVVYAGRLSVWRASDSGQAQKIGILGRGDIFGEISFFLKSPRSATVTTETDCTLFRLPAQEFSRILRKRRLLSRWAKGIACERVTKFFQEE